MEHQQVERMILDGRWSRDDLEQAAELLSHIRHCAQCDKALRDYDSVRSQLADDAGIQDVQPQGGWDAFYARLKPANSNRSFSRWWWPGGATIAASLLIVMIGGAILLRQARPPEVPVDYADSSPGTLLPFVSREDIDAFKTVSQMFDGDAGWIALSERGSDMGMASHPGADSKRLMLLRLTLTDATGNVVTETDLLILHGQKANFTVAADDGQVMTYQVSVSEHQPNRLAVRGTLERDGQLETPEAIAANLDLRPNQVASAGEMFTEFGSYNLLVGFREASLN